MLHQFDIFSAPGTIAHGSIRLPPRNKTIKLHSSLSFPEIEQLGKK